jgi:hypothetical protein
MNMTILSLSGTDDAPFLVLMQISATIDSTYVLQQNAAPGLNVLREMLRAVKKGGSRRNVWHTKSQQNNQGWNHRSYGLSMLKFCTINILSFSFHCVRVINLESFHHK